MITRRERIETAIQPRPGAPVEWYHSAAVLGWVIVELRALWKVVDAASDDTATQAGWSRFVDALDEYKAGQDD